MEALRRVPAGQKGNAQRAARFICPSPSSNALVRPRPRHSQMDQSQGYGSASPQARFADTGPTPRSCSEGEESMSATTSTEQIAEQNSTSNEFEGEIREFVRKDVAPWRKRPDRAEAPTETQAENVSMLVQRVA